MLAQAGCGEDTGGSPVLHFYTPADAATQYAAAAVDCTAAAGGRYAVVQETQPKSADDQRVQLARRLVAGDPSVDLMAMDVTWTAEFAEAVWIRAFPADVARQVESGTLPAAYDRAERPARAAAERLLRIGYVKIDGNGILDRDFYLLADQVAGLSGDVVRLSVDREELVRES